MRQPARQWILLLVTACAGCGGTIPPAPSSPGITQMSSVEADDPRLEQKGPLLYHGGELLSGTVTRHTQGGSLLSRTPYEAGKKEGFAISFHSDGSPATEGTWSDNRKTGVHRGWWPGGKEKFVAHYEDDVYEGSVKEWFENGNLYRSFHYRNGHEDGPQKMWTTDGTLRANYEIRNGRRYGWVGSVPCSSPLKETLENME